MPKELYCLDMLIKYVISMKPVNIQLSEDTIKQAKTIAELEQIPYSILLRNWIVKGIREYAHVSPPRPTGAASSQL